MNTIKEEQKYILPTYKRYPLVLVKGKGQYVWDDKGRKYLDFFAGLSVCNVGHCHPKVVAAIRKQANTLLHVSNLYYTPPQVRLAADLIKASFPGQVFFSNSGAEANECAIKIARKRGKGKRYEVITFTGSFHGRTLATLAATGQKKFHKGFEPMPGGFVCAGFNDLAAVKKAVTGRTAAILVEPVQGEGGVNVAAKEFLAGLRALCDKHGLLLIFDEIQSGLGRTGELFAYQHYGIRPDIMTLAKSLAGGLPLGATIAGRKALGVLGYGDHGSTFGGNLTSCAAASEVLRILSPSLLSHASSVGRYFLSGLKTLQSKHPAIKEVRGVGLMLGLELDFPGRDIVQFCQGKGLLINCTQDTILRFLPPLVITTKDADKALRILEEAFQWHR
ncbi:MAG: aspartate aminotransferase family protein [Endomicrobiales bacterium]